MDNCLLGKSFYITHGGYHLSMWTRPLCIQYCITHGAWHLSEASPFFFEHLTGCNWQWQPTLQLYLVAVTILRCTIYSLDEHSMQQKASIGMRQVNLDFSSFSRTTIKKPLCTFTFFYCFSHLHKDRPIFQNNFENIIFRNSWQFLIHLLMKKLQLEQVKEIKT